MHAIKGGRDLDVWRTQILPRLSARDVCRFSQAFKEANAIGGDARTWNALLMRDFPNAEARPDQDPRQYYAELMLSPQVESARTRALEADAMMPPAMGNWTRDDIPGARAAHYIHVMRRGAPGPLGGVAALFAWLASPVALPLAFVFGDVVGNGLGAPVKAVVRRTRAHRERADLRANRAEANAEIERHHKMLEQAPTRRSLDKDPK